MDDAYVLTLNITCLRYLKFFFLQKKNYKNIITNNPKDLTVNLNRAECLLQIKKYHTTVHALDCSRKWIKGTESHYSIVFAYWFFQISDKYKIYVFNQLLSTRPFKWYNCFFCKCNSFHCRKQMLLFHFETVKQRQGVVET